MTTTPATRDDLREVCAAWMFLDVDFEQVINVAELLLAEGDQAPAIVEIASLYPEAFSVDRQLVVSRAMHSIGYPDLVVGSETLEILALRRKCAEYLSGNLSLRGLARWAHSNMGHSGPTFAQPLVELEDRYQRAELPANISPDDGFTLEQSLHISQYLTDTPGLGLHDLEAVGQLHARDFLRLTHHL
ncbi:hypothetical protein [Lysinibacter cavernae]|uniref:Uncharacterized protein n=1 Tax=Lysinibacter cavernae TaxID=1640652 RepID=A0A7X5TUC7_9MICO|nr:hypothetical protein [Lysinibacter cavernae]NIH53452.1 hypothetical protein [Lysinibacter cavernae]